MRVSILSLLFNPSLHREPRAERWLGEVSVVASTPREDRYAQVFRPRAPGPPHRELRAFAWARSCQPSPTPTPGRDSAGPRPSLRPRGRQGAACASSPGPSALAVAQRHRREQGAAHEGRRPGQGLLEFLESRAGKGVEGRPLTPWHCQGKVVARLDAPHAAPAPRGPPGLAPACPDAGPVPARARNRRAAGSSR